MMDSELKTVAICHRCQQAIEVGSDMKFVDHPDMNDHPCEWSGHFPFTRYFTMRKSWSHLMITQTDVYFTRWMDYELKDMEGVIGYISLGPLILKFEKDGDHSIRLQRFLFIGTIGARYVPFQSDTLNVISNGIRPKMVIDLLKMEYMIPSTGQAIGGFKEIEIDHL